MNITEKILSAAAPDSTIVSQLKEISEHINIIDKKVTLSPWIPIITVIITSIVLLLAQYLDRRVKKQLELKNQLIDLLADSELLLSTLKNSLKELSINKNMAKYWWYFYNTEYSKVNKNEKYESDYLENHRNTSLAITKCELQIGETLSKLYSTISKIKRLSKHSTLDITFIGDLITNIDLLPSAENIPENTPRQRAMDIYTNNKAILYQTYLTQISRLDTLLDELRT